MTHISAGLCTGALALLSTIVAVPSAPAQTSQGQVSGAPMFAGSWPDQIGNADDAADIDISKKGITIVDPRWHRTNDAVSRFLVMLPLRDVSGENICNQRATRYQP